jgi:hypothetical protein
MVAWNRSLGLSFLMVSSGEKGWPCQPPPEKRLTGPRYERLTSGAALKANSLTTWASASGNRRLGASTVVRLSCAQAYCGGELPLRFPFSGQVVRIHLNG